MSRWCKTCGEFMLFPETHVCPTRWEVCEPEYDPDEWVNVFASDAKEAVEKWAEEEDCSWDYRIVGGQPAVEIVGGQPVVVIVRGPDGSESKFRVSGKMVPEYYAEPIDE